MEFEATGASTIYLRVPTDAAFQQLIDLKELPESILEIAEVRVVDDTYFDTTDLRLLGLGMDVRTTIVAEHDFLIFNEVLHPDTLLARSIEHVERLTPEERALIHQNDRSHKLFRAIDKTEVSTGLVPVLHRRAVFQSRLFRVGETRFELGLEAIAYERAGQTVTEQAVSLDLIQGDEEILEAMAQYLADQFELERFYESPLARGVQLIGR